MSKQGPCVERLLVELAVLLDETQRVVHGGHEVLDLLRDRRVVLTNRNRRSLRRRHVCLEQRQVHARNRCRNRVGSTRQTNVVKLKLGILSLNQLVSESFLK